MSIPQFDITGPGLDPESIRRSLLLLEAAPRQFRYLVYDPDEKKLTGFRQYSVDPEGDLSEMEILRGIFSNDELLREAPLDTVIVYDYPESSLLQEKFYNPDMNRPLAELIYGDASEGLVLNEKVAGWDLYNVYRIPRDVHHLLQEKFPGSRHWHFYSLFLSSIGQGNAEGAAIYLLMEEKKFTLCVFSDGRLQLMQSYPYQEPEDVTYYLLSVCRQWDLDQRETAIKLGGLVDEDSSLYREIHKYFLKLVFQEPLPGIPADWSLLQEGYPSHYFSPLLSALSCV